MTRFVQAVTDSGQVIDVPEDWIGHPVLGHNLDKTPAQKVADGEVEAKQLADPPTERSKVDEIQDFARDAGIDLGDAGTKKEMLEIIDAHLAAAPADLENPTPPVNPEVQTVLGEELTESTVPAANAAKTQGDAPLPDENPATGDEEN